MVQRFQFLFFCGVVSLGCGARTGIDVPPPVEVPSANNAYECTCECFPTGPLGGDRLSQTIQVCMPPELNENLGGSPTVADLEFDCAERVSNIAHASYELSGLVGESCRNDCTCTVSRGPFFGGPACDETCMSVPLEGAFPPTNLKEATVRPLPWPCRVIGSDDRPVCRVPGSDPPVPLPEGGAASFLSPESVGVVTSGTARIVIDGREFVTPVTGEVSFPGRPCPGSSCSVNLAFDLTADPFEVGSFIGLAGVTLERISAGGAGTPGVLALDASGTGTYPPGTVQAWGRGDAVERVLGIETSRTRSAFLLVNTDPIVVTLDWTGRRFVIDDEFSLPAGDDPTADPAITVEVDLEGTLTNQPPTARIETAPAVECSSPSGAEIVLDGSPSSDPDANLAGYTWHLGALPIHPLVDPAFALGPSITVLQAPGTAQDYSLFVSDSAFQAAQETATVVVADTVAPSIHGISVDPTCLWPPNHRFVRYVLGEHLRVDASDVCDDEPLIRIVDVRSSEPDDGGGDGATAGDVRFGETGFCLRAERSGHSRSGRRYTVEVEVEDHFGNASRAEMTIEVPHDRASTCADVPADRVVHPRDADRLCRFEPAVRAPRMVAAPRLVTDPAPDASSAATSPAATCAATPGTQPSGLFVVVASLALVLHRRRRG